MPPYHIPETLKIIILATVQGIAEFLPISSSGHLVVINTLFGTNPDDMLGLGIVLHLGTLLAILVFYRARIIALFSEDRRVIGLLIAGTIPAACLGIYLKKYQEWITVDPLLSGFMLTVTGFILMALPGNETDETKKAADNEKSVDNEKPGKLRIEYQQMGYVTAILIGCAQAFAILPGISRSGTTIVAGYLLGLKRQSAATFSFLLAIPAIGGATLLEGIDIVSDPNLDASGIGMLVLGMVVSFSVGWLALCWLVKWLEAGSLRLFAYWVIPLGFLVIVWQLYQLVLNQAG